MKLKPLFDRVILKQIDAEENVKGGIFLSASNEQKSNMAEVVEVGPGGTVDGEEIKMVLKKGQTVLFNKYAAIEFKSNKETFLIIKQTDIIAVVEEK